MQHLNGKVVLITGGGSGMGRQAAQMCAAAGAIVALLDVNETGMAETCRLASGSAISWAGRARPWSNAMDGTCRKPVRSARISSNLARN